MINFDYDLWEKVCLDIKEYANNYGKYYLQLYPFSFDDYIDHISIEFFYDNFIKNGGIFELNNFEFPENLAIKPDGTLRTRYLLTPIIYLYYIAVGKYISTKFKTLDISNYDCYYAGDFALDEYHYKNSYNRFISKVEENAINYDYYLKLDINSFFDNIDLRKLKKILINNGSLNETEANVLEKLLFLCGNGKMPQTECGITSSYLATVCYLNNLDSLLVEYLSSYSYFDSFKVTRYVDDIFIFFSLNKKIKLSQVENDIVNFLNNIYHDYSLSINKMKISCKKSNKVYLDIKSFSFAEDPEIEESVDDLFRKNIINKFLNEMIKCVNKNGINYKKYNEIVNSNFNSKKVRYHASQIYYSLIYKSSKWISKTETKDALKRALDSDYNIMVQDPKILTTLIMKTEDTELIKKMLEKLFAIYRNGEWNVICTYISLIYLFNSKFKHIDLLKIIKEKDLILYNYINKYCKSSWHFRCFSPNNRKFVTESYKKQSNLYYLSLMYIYELKNCNYLNAYAYYKNYFDVITAHFAHRINPKGKFSIESYYKEKDLKKFYEAALPEETDFIDSTLKKTAEYRNGDPVCHGSCQMLDSVNQTELLLKNIEDLNKIINMYILKEL